MASFIKDLSDEKLVRLLRECYQFEPTTGVINELFRMDPLEFGTMSFTRANILTQCSLEVGKRVMLANLGIIDRCTGEIL